MRRSRAPSRGARGSIQRVPRHQAAPPSCDELRPPIHPCDDAPAPPLHPLAAAAVAFAACLPAAAAFGVCCYCDLWANAAAALVLLLHGIPTAPSWDRPWLQTSLGDFWARRWNLPASASLKHLAFDPAVEGAAA